MLSIKKQPLVLHYHENARSGIFVTIPALEQLMSSFTPENDRALLESYMILAESDSHFSSEMNKRINAVSGLPYKFDKDESGKLFQLFNEYVNLNELISQMMQSVIYGFSIMQIEWKQDGGIWTIDGIKIKPPHMFKRTINDEITLVRNNDLNNTEELAANQWIVHRHNYAKPIPYLNGIMRSLSKPLLYKRLAMLDKDRFLATYGVPVKVGHYPIGSTEEDVELFQTFIKDLTTNASGCLPEGFDIEVFAASTATIDAFDSAVSYADAQTNLAINGGTISTSATNVGSRALGEVLDKGRLELITDDAKQIINTLNKQLVPLFFKGLGMVDNGVKLMIDTTLEVAGSSNSSLDGTTKQQPSSKP